MFYKILLRGRLDRKQSYRLIMLLVMTCTPHKLAGEMDFNRQKVYRV
jgi:hypothetical protein